jgi:molybdopterin synthase catalytic subunit
MANNDRMANIRIAVVTADRLSVHDMIAAVGDPAAGATVSFSGDVRNHDGGRSVQTLTYEGHPNAERILAEVASDVAQRFDIIALAVAHRIGPIPIGESALVAAVSAAHRGEAFAAGTELVEQVKAQLPVWKHQVFTDGTEEWVNCA